MVTPALNAAALWSGLLILIFTALTIRVTLNRRQLKISMGDGGNPEMIAVTRAAGNAAEYVPPAVAVLILMALTGCPVWSIHAIGGAFFLGRALHPIGLSATGLPGPGRAGGMILTWLPLILGSLALIVHAILR